MMMMIMMMMMMMMNPFVAGEGFLSRQVSRVEFIPTTAKPQPTMPPDISRDEFCDMNDVLTTCMPRSQLGTVISSYEKTIGMQKTMKACC